MTNSVDSRLTSQLRLTIWSEDEQSAINSQNRHHENLDFGMTTPCSFLYLTTICWPGYARELVATSISIKVVLGTDVIISTKKILSLSIWQRLAKQPKREPGCVWNLGLLVVWSSWAALSSTWQSEISLSFAGCQYKHLPGIMDMLHLPRRAWNSKWSYALQLLNTA